MSFLDKIKGSMSIEAPGKEKGKEKGEEKKKLKEGEKIQKMRVEEEPPSEGELAIDVYETDGDFVIQSTIAGVKAEDLDISIENDLITIKGNRQKPTETGEGNFLYQECYWGPFSRQLILPEEVNGEGAEAKMKDGVLTLRIPKAQKIKKKKILIQQEE